MNDDTTSTPGARWGSPAVPAWMSDLARLVDNPAEYARWREMVTAIGGCQHPVHLSGASRE